MFPAVSMPAPESLIPNQFVPALTDHGAEPRGDDPSQDTYMGFSIAPLLIHNEGIPLAARRALEAATFGPVEDRTAQLETAARAIYAETDLNCTDVREIVGLDTCGGCR